MSQKPKKPKPRIWWVVKSGDLLLAFTASFQRQYAIKQYDDAVLREVNKYANCNRDHVKAVKIEVREIG